MKGLLLWLRRPWPLRLSAWILGLTFLAAALPKLADPPGFAEAIHAYRLVPGTLLAPMALFLPWLELLMALALISGLARRGAALLSLLLLLLFMGGIGLNLMQGHPIDCGCFGALPIARTVTERLGSMRLDLLRDGALALLALINLVGPRRES